jgi:lycopene cyclase domain-containing protein
MSLYLLLNILTLSIPLLLSFDKKVHFYTRWRYFFPAMILTLAVFILWDVIFASRGVWGFNERYHGEFTLFGLPLEEYLFFITVPYASVFTIYVMAGYFPGVRLNDKQALVVSLVLITFLLVIAAININRAYTAVNFIFSALLIGWVCFARRMLLSQFYFSYLVNGILTGSFIEEQVVWYNDEENLGIRLGTIPFEDIFYGMSLVLMNYYLTETFREMRRKRIAV